MRFGLLGSVAVAGWHVLVVYGVIADPCVVPIHVESLEDFERMLSIQPPCATAGGKMLGVPMAAYNLLGWGVLCY